MIALLGSGLRRDSLSSKAYGFGPRAVGTRSPSDGRERRASARAKGVEPRLSCKMECVRDKVLLTLSRFLFQPCVVFSFSASPGSLVSSVHRVGGGALFAYG